MWTFDVHGSLNERHKVFIEIYAVKRTMHAFIAIMIEYLISKI